MCMSIKKLNFINIMKLDKLSLNFPVVSFEDFIHS